MQPNEVKAFLEKALPNATIQVSGAGCDFQLIVVSDDFESMSAVKRQQTVYAHLSPYITDGSIHAVSMQTFSPQEWANNSTTE